jgi:hypothetical protein
MAPQRALLSLIACLFVCVSQGTAWSVELKVFARAESVAEMDLRSPRRAMLVFWPETCLSEGDASSG